MVLALIFAEILAGGVLLVSGITGRSPAEVVKAEGESHGFGTPAKDASEAFKGIEGLAEKAVKAAETPGGKAYLEEQTPQEAVKKELGASKESRVVGKLSTKEKNLLKELIKSGEVTEKELTEVLKGKLTVKELQGRVKEKESKKSKGVVA